MQNFKILKMAPIIITCQINKYYNNNLPRNGARNIDKLLTEILLPIRLIEVLNQRAKNGKKNEIMIHGGIQKKMTLDVRQSRERVANIFDGKVPTKLKVEERCGEV